MNREEKKDYILKKWDVSSGKKISEMLRRYTKQHWKKKEDPLIKTVQEVFETE